MRYFIYITFISLCFHQASFAATYKWTDAEGQVHFSQHPPQDDSEFETIKAPVTAQQFEADKDNHGDDDNPEDKDDEDEKPLTAKEIRQQNCDSSKARLAILQQNKTVSMKNAEGKTSILNEKQRQAEIEQTKAAVQSHCTVIENDE